MPVANAGPDRTVFVNEPISLDGSASTGAHDGLQADGRHSIRWDFGYEGWTYEGSTTAPIAYPAVGTYTAFLTVVDSSGVAATDSTTITVLPIPEGSETVLTDTGNPVTNRDNLQAAIDARTGTNNPVITLPIGFIARGTLLLRHRTSATYLTIRTAGHGSLPNSTTRVAPSDSTNMAVLEQSVSDMIVDVPVPSSTPPRYYRFLGVHFRKSNASLSYTHTFVQLGQTGATSLSQLPDHVQFDRCLFDGGSTTSNTLRGLMLRASDVAVVNCYFYRFKGVGIESQAALSVAGERQAFINNFMEAATENYMSGGTSPSITNHVPTDVVFRRNHLKKDLGWRSADPSYYGTNMVIKNLFEIKLGKRYSVQGNIFENHWVEDQPGYGIVFTPRNDENNAPWSQVSLIDFAHNKIIKSDRALNVLGADDLHPSLTTNRIIVRHNTWAGVNWTGTDISNSFILPGGVTGPDRVFIVNNSVDQNGNPEFGHGRLVNFETGSTMTNLVFSGNIGQGFFNHEGGTGTTAFQLATGGSYSATKNGFYRSNGTNPTGNTTVAALSDVKYTNVAAFDLSLANDSPFLTTGFNGGRSGADTTTLGRLNSGTLTGIWGPTVTSISPNSGTTAGGTSVTISGTNFQSGVTVSIGGVLATSVVLNNSLSLTCKTGTNTAGAKNVVVTNPDGQSGTLVDGFTYVAPGNPNPTVISVSPNSGTTAGGTAVTITGTGFLAGATATFGGTPLVSSVLISSTSITGITPAHAAGAVNIVVTNSDTKSGTLSSGFTYVEPPPPPPPPPPTRNLTISSTSPNSGVTITVSPQDLNGLATGVTSFTRFYTDQTLVSLAAPTLAGSNTFLKWQRDGVDISTSPLINVVMDTNHVVTAVYQAPAPPPPPPPTFTLSVSSDSPSSGVAMTVSPVDKNQQGNGSTPFTRTYDLGTAVTVTTPSQAGGSIFLQWLRDGAASTTSLSTIVTMDANHSVQAVYETLEEPIPQPPAPTIISVTPNRGSLEGGLSVVVTGTGFQTGAIVTFDGAAAAGVEVVSSSSIRCVVPANETAGKVNVVVQNPDGKLATKLKGFQYLKTGGPKNTKISPNGGLIIL